MFKVADHYSKKSLGNYLQINLWKKSHVEEALTVSTNYFDVFFSQELEVL